MFGQSVRAHRQRVGLTQEELAERSGLSVRSIVKIETGRTAVPRPSTVRMLAEAFGLDGADVERFQQSAAVESVDGRPPAPRPDPLNGSESAAVLAQLPPAVRDFVGRAHELDRLDTILSSAGTQPTAVPIAVISGSAGMGKSALAVHWAHRVVDRFPDGQLYLNLRGFAPTGDPITPTEAIRRFLDALNVPARHIPDDPSAQIDLYRSRLAGKRVLIVLDNARNAEQLRPLLPGAPGCLVLATSRNRLTSLIAAEGAYSIILNRFTMAEAQVVLARRLGPELVAADPGVADRLTAASACLPLALVIIAARAVVHPGVPLTVLADDLDDSDRRLDTITGGDITTDLRAVISWSYRALSDDAARLFRLLGLHPGPDITTTAAASLAGTTPAQTRALLAELTDAHLITEELPRRYALHDLLRVYATEQAHFHDDEAVRHSAMHRILDHYLHTAHTAAMRLTPGRAPIVLQPQHAGVTVETPADRPQAIAWFTSMRAVLLAVVNQAGSNGFHGHCWKLAWTLTDFLVLCGRWQDLAAAQQVALAAAQRLDDTTGQAHAHLGLAVARMWSHRYDEAHAHVGQALDLFLTDADHAAAIAAHFDRGYIFERQQHYAEALACAQSALALAETTDVHTERGRAFSNVGWYHALLGRHDEAIAYCQRAMAVHLDAGNRGQQAATLDTLGYAHHHIGHHEQAITCYRRASELFQDLGDTECEATVLTHLGDTYAECGEPQAARHAWQRAHNLFHDLNHPDAALIKTKLGSAS